MSSSFKSQMATVASLSLLEKLDTVTAILSVLANTFASVFTGAFRGKETRGPLLYRYICLTALRTMTRRLSVRQTHYMIAPTDTSYEQICKKRGVTPDSEVLEDGTKAHWIGDKKAEKLIINFHGGGYVVPASPEMVEFMFKVVDTLTENGKSVAVLFLSYDLAPGAVYPRQLQQAAALLNHVLHTLKVSPKDIVLTGDSAGANLMIGLLSHISHPWNESHPTSSSVVSLKGGIPPVNLGDEKFCGAVMISPWISFSLAEPSFKKNAYKDVIDPRSGKQWSSAWMNTPHPHANNTDYYNQAITAPTSWWKDIKVDNVLIVAGKDEVLIDGIMKFTEKFGEGFGKEKLQVFVADDEYHDQPSLDIGLGYVKPGQQALKIQEWVSSKL